MATTTYDFAREEAWYQSAKGTGSSVTDDAYFEFEDALTTEEKVLACQKMITRLLSEDGTA